ncbi:MAG: alpha/beta hydrolase-fold protein [Vicinamibacterales bacterium]|nr:alpha/beta hydrolase-fold protein [Vicinamibacterales bacterium]
MTARGVWTWRAVRAVVLVVAVAGLAGCAGEPTSFRLLQRSIEGLGPAEKTAAIERYIAAAGGTPLVENQSRLIFLARSRDGVAPRAVGDFNRWANTPAGYDLSVGEMTPIEGTDYYWMQSEAYSNARLEYVLLYERDPVPDPLNPLQISSIVGPRSEIRMPFWSANAEIDDTSPVPAGTVVEERITSRALGEDRRVWFYLPPGYEESDTLYPVVFILDGATWVEGMEVPTVLDRLFARQAARPVIAVFVEPGHRQQEYSRSTAWRQFMATELVPLVDQRYRTFPSPDQRALLGSSLGAYAAVDLAVEAPGVFGTVGAIAPPVQTATILTNQAHARAAVRSLRIAVVAAVYDEMVDGARRLRTALYEADAAVTYIEVAEGHNWNMFRGALDDLLRAVLVEE